MRLPPTRTAVLRTGLLQRARLETQAKGEYVGPAVVINADEQSGRGHAFAALPSVSAMPSLAPWLAPGASSAAQLRWITSAG
jgi:hypothetical protein